MRSAEQPKIRGLMTASRRARLKMIDLEVPAPLAPSARPVVVKRALPSIAMPDEPADRRGNLRRNGMPLPEPVRSGSSTRNRDGLPDLRLRALGLSARSPLRFTRMK